MYLGRPRVRLTPLLRGAAEVVCGLGMPAALRLEVPETLSFLGLTEGHKETLQGLRPVSQPPADGMCMANEAAYGGQHGRG